MQEQSVTGLQWLCEQTFWKTALAVVLRSTTIYNKRNY